MYDSHARNIVPLTLIPNHTQRSTVNDLPCIVDIYKFLNETFRILVA